MNYSEFLDYVKTHILEKVENSENAKVIIEQFVKNNGVVLDGLRISREGEQAVPNVYLNAYYQDLENGMPLSVVLEYIAEACRRQNVISCNVDEIFMFPEKKENIILRLVNFEKNKEQLETCPYIPFHDLAITFRFLVHMDEVGIGTALITQKEMERWKIEIDTLYRIALENTKRIFPPKIQRVQSVIRDLLAEICGEEIMDGKISDAIPMFVLSNQLQVNGATCILYKDVLKQFAKTYQADVFILPSSIHEVILVPDRGDMGKENLYEIVKEANESVVEETEMLSDTVYKYKQSENSIKIL